MKRTFIAICIEPQKSLLDFAAQLKTTFINESINWSTHINFHITLAFLGDTGDEQIAEVDKLIQQVGRANKPFTARLEGFGIFNANRKPKVIWIGMQNFEPLGAVKNALELGLEQLGFETDPRIFRPHLTLGRVRHINDRIRLGQFVEDHSAEFFQEVPVHKLVYYESILTPKGPIYNVIETYALG